FVNLCANVCPWAKMCVVGPSTPLGYSPWRIHRTALKLGGRRFSICFSALIARSVMPSAGGRRKTVIDIQETREFIAARFAAAEVDSVPSPHILIANFFPDTVYDQILGYNLFRYTAGTEWISKSTLSNRRQDTPFHMRKQVDLREPLEAPPEARDFWIS